MSVADIGAGEGYYTVRLAPRGRREGPGAGRGHRARRRAIALSERVQRERLDNVAVRLGKPDDPMLPAPVVRPRLPGPHVSRDAAPYAFLWHLREALKPDGAGHRRRCRPAREAARHAAARCSTASSPRSGMEPVKFADAERRRRLFAWRFALARTEPGPDKIEPCKRPRAGPSSGSWCNRRRRRRDDRGSCNRVLPRLPRGDGCSGSPNRSGARIAARVIMGEDDAARCRARPRRR